MSEMASAPEIAEYEFRSGSGRLCLDFIRTLRWRGTDEALDELATPEALAAWIAQLGPYGADTEIVDELLLHAPTPRTVRAARETREAVYSLLKAARATTAANCPPEARAVLNKTASAPTPYPVLTATGELTHTAADPIGATLAAIARDALELAASPLLARVRDCAGPNCGAWFLDTSRPGTRRWCSMDRCGNQAKKSAWRSRHPNAG